MADAPDAPTPAPPSTSVHEIGEADLAEVAEFLDRQRRPGEALRPAALSPVQRLRWLLLDNPARADDIPFGWCIRAEVAAGGPATRGTGGGAGRVVGAMVCVPFRFAAGGVGRIALMSCKFYVDEAFRGLGLGLFLRFTREGRRFPLFATSANAASGGLFAHFGGRVIAGTGHTMLGIARPAPLIEEWLHRRARRPMLSRLLAFPAALLPGRLRRRGAAAGGLTPLRSADEAAALCQAAPSEIPGGGPAVVRDRPYLHWRYFSGEGGKEAYAFHCGGDKASNGGRSAGESSAGAGSAGRLVVVELPRSGHRGQIRVLNVLDLWPPLSPASAPALAAALARHYRGRFDALWLRSQPPPAEAALARAGFARHEFPAPLGWCIDRSADWAGRAWYLMPGESE